MFYVHALAIRIEEWDFISCYRRLSHFWEPNDLSDTVYSLISFGLIASISLLVSHSLVSPPLGFPAGIAMVLILTSYSVPLAFQELS